MKSFDMYGTPSMRIRIAALIVSCVLASGAAVADAGSSGRLPFDKTSAKAIDPLARIFVGIPNQLTLPPAFPIEAATSPQLSVPSEFAGDTTKFEVKPVGNGIARIEQKSSPDILAASLPSH